MGVLASITLTDGGPVDVVIDVVGSLLGVVFTVIGAIVGVFAQMVANILDLLPDATDLALEIPSGWLYGYSWLNGFVPLSEMLAFAVILAGAQLVPVVWRSAVTLYHLIPKPMIGT